MTPKDRFDKLNALGMAKPYFITYSEYKKVVDEDCFIYVKPMRERPTK